MFQVRDRLNSYFRKHEQSNVRCERMILVAVDQVGMTLDFLDIALDDYKVANREYRTEQEQFMNDVRFNESGGEPRRAYTEEEIAERRRGYLRLHYRIDTFYVFAGMILDDVAALLDRALAPSAVEIGKHRGIAAHLPTIAADKGLSGSEEVVAHGEELAAAIKVLRDDYVVHRSIKQPRAMRYFTWKPGEEGTRIDYGLAYRREGEKIPFVQSTELVELHDKVNRYVDVVLDFLEPLPVVMEIPVQDLAPADQTA
jgi:hypothetical protein